MFGNDRADEEWNNLRDHVRRALPEFAGRSPGRDGRRTVAVLDPPDGDTRDVLADRTGVNADGGDRKPHANGGGELRTLAFQTVAISDHLVQPVAAYQ